MSSEKSKAVKTKLHSRNKNRERYNLTALINAIPELANYVKPNKYGDDSVDFSNPEAVKYLNKALLKHYYGISFWEFPDENLCPPIPGRADYLHYIADLLSETNQGEIPTGEKITCLDVGVGANCIYPILGVVEYGWNFIASDVSSKSLDSAKQIIASNVELKNKVECRLQEHSRHVFRGLLSENDKIDVTICNPPFHESIEVAEAGTKRKIKNLSGKDAEKAALNFSGIAKELVYEGGEIRFIQTMVRESRMFTKNCLWFSTLVSKQSNLKDIYRTLKKAEAKQVKTFDMGTSNKSTRIVAWTFLNYEERKAWQKSRW